MARKPKPVGRGKRPHGAKCGVCAKPKRERKEKLMKIRANQKGDRNE